MSSSARINTKLIEWLLL